jgi:hypothetical protein
MANEFFLKGRHFGIDAQSQLLILFLRFLQRCIFGFNFGLKIFHHLFKGLPFD